MPFKAVLPRLLALPPAHDLYVTGEAGELLGVIALDALKGNIPDEGLLGMIVAADVMDEDVRPITTAMTLEAWVRPTVISNAWVDVVYKGNDNYFLMAMTDRSFVPAGGGRGRRVGCGGGAHATSIGVSYL